MRVNHMLTMIFVLDVALGTKICAHSAITVENKKATIDHNKYVGCGRCIGICPQDAVCPASDESNDILNYKIAEYSKAVVARKTGILYQYGH